MNCQREFEKESPVFEVVLFLPRSKQSFCPKVRPFWTQLKWILGQDLGKIASFWSLAQNVPEIRVQMHKHPHCALHATHISILQL